MTRSLSMYLRKRMNSAIEGGLSARDDARQFEIARKQKSNDTNAIALAVSLRRKQGKLSRSKLDQYETFVLRLIEDQPDITLVEIDKRLVPEHDVKAAPSPICQFLAKRSITSKMQRTRQDRRGQMS